MRWLLECMEEGGVHASQSKRVQTRLDTPFDTEEVNKCRPQSSPTSTKSMIGKTFLAAICFMKVLENDTVSAEKEFCMNRVKNGKLSTVKPCKASTQHAVISDLDAKIRRRAKSTSEPKTTFAQTTEVATTTSPTPTSNKETHILLGQRFALYLLSIAGNSLTRIVSYSFNVTSLVAIDYDPLTEYIYWTGNNVISRARANDTVSQTIISNVSSEADGVAVDWVARNLYWTDKIRGIIEVSRLDGSSRKILVNTDIEFPRAIAVDPARGYMYWSDWGSAPKIEVASLGGDNRRVIINDSIAWPNGIAIDYEYDMLYWVDSYLDKIEAVNLSSLQRLKLAEFDHHIFGFTYLNDYVYWTDWLNGTAERLSVINPTASQLIVRGSQVMGMKAYDDSPRTETNNCSISNGGCSNLCLYSPMGAKCSCPDNYVLQTDEKTCRPV